MLFEPKYFSKNSRDQLRICNTLDCTKNQKNHFETGKESSFTLPMSVPPPSMQSSVPREIHLARDFSLGEKSELGMHLISPAFWDAAQEIYFCMTSHTDCCGGNQQLECLKAAENKEKGWAAPW